MTGFALSLLGFGGVMALWLVIDYLGPAWLTRKIARAAAWAGIKKAFKETRRHRHDWQPIYGVETDERCVICGKER